MIIMVNSLSVCHISFVMLQLDSRSPKLSSAYDSAGGLFLEVCSYLPRHLVKLTRCNKMPGHSLNQWRFYYWYWQSRWCYIPGTKKGQFRLKLFVSMPAYGWQATTQTYNFRSFSDLGSMVSNRPKPDNKVFFWSRGVRPRWVLKFSLVFFNQKKLSISIFWLWFI